jgi:hypothetical protein
MKKPLTYIRFKEATKCLAGSTEIPFTVTPDGVVVTAVELSKNEIRELEKSGGRIYILSMTGAPPPQLLQIGSPFAAAPQSKIIKLNGSHYGKEDTTPQGPSDDK